MAASLSLTHSPISDDVMTSVCGSDDGLRLAFKRDVAGSWLRVSFLSQWWQAAVTFSLNSCFVPPLLSSWYSCMA